MAVNVTILVQKRDFGLRNRIFPIVFLTQEFSCGKAGDALKRCKEIASSVKAYTFAYGLNSVIAIVLLVLYASASLTYSPFRQQLREVFMQMLIDYL